MKWIGQHIVDLIARFRGEVYLEDTVHIGKDDDTTETIKRLRHTDDNGGNLFIRGGDATGTNKNGGNLALYGGRNTGNGDGGHIYIILVQEVVLVVL